MAFAAVVISDALGGHSQLVDGELAAREFGHLRGEHAGCDQRVAAELETLDENLGCGLRLRLWRGDDAWQHRVHFARFDTRCGLLQRGAGVGADLCVSVQRERSEYGTRQGAAARQGQNFGHRGSRKWCAIILADDL